MIAWGGGGPGLRVSAFPVPARAPEAGPRIDADPNGRRPDRRPGRLEDESGRIDFDLSLLQPVAQQVGRRGLEPGRHPMLHHAQGKQFDDLFPMLVQLRRPRPGRPAQAHALSPLGRQGRLGPLADQVPLDLRRQGQDHGHDL